MTCVGGPVQPGVRWRRHLVAAPYGPGGTQRARNAECSGSSRVSASRRSGGGASALASVAAANTPEVGAVAE